MFSATFPKESRALARAYMDEDYVRVRIGRAGSTHRNVTQDIIYVERDLKRKALYDLLFDREPCRTLIFCNSRGAVEAVDDYLFNEGLPTAFMHGDRSQLEREDAMRSFKAGTTPILISTNIFGRGIDVPEVQHVINYDLPSIDHGGITEYIHRIGRTGRIGHKGHATSFYNERNEDLAPALVNILLETDQEVPDFLDQFKPEGGKAEFQDDTDDEEQGGDYTTDAAGGWGTADTADVTAPADISADGWGVAETSTTGFDAAPAAVAW